MYDNAKLASNAIRENYDKNVEYYSDYMRSDLMERQQIINDMKKALKSDQFEVWLQPLYNHATGSVIGAEVLARWNRNVTYVMPKVFIPIFEQNGFIYRMDKYIWEASCALLRRWIDNGKDVLPLSVNVSRRDILHDDFISFMAGLIKKYDISPDLLRLEITEYAFSGSSKVIIEKVRKLINLGFTVEIDDFGSGYSSLNTLKDVPASVIKLDMRFFENRDNIRVLYKNRGFYSMFGYTKEQFENELNHANDLILPEDLDGALKAVESVVNTKQPLTHEFRAESETAILSGCKLQIRLLTLTT